MKTDDEYKKIEISAQIFYGGYDIACGFLKVLLKKLPDYKQPEELKNLLSWHDFFKENNKKYSIPK